MCPYPETLNPEQLAEWQECFRIANTRRTKSETDSRLRHDYFGRGANEVMHRLRALRDEVIGHPLGERL